MQLSFFKKHFSSKITQKKKLELKRLKRDFLKRIDVISARLSPYKKKGGSLTNTSNWSNSIKGYTKN
jgi:hypothetical protein